MKRPYKYAHSGVPPSIAAAMYIIVKNRPKGGRVTLMPLWNAILELETPMTDVFSTLSGSYHLQIALNNAYMQVKADNIQMLRDARVLTPPNEVPALRRLAEPRASLAIAAFDDRSKEWIQVLNGLLGDFVRWVLSLATKMNIGKAWKTAAISMIQAETTPIRYDDKGGVVPVSNNLQKAQSIWDWVRIARNVVDEETKTYIGERMQCTHCGHIKDN